VDSRNPDKAANKAATANHSIKAGPQRAGLLLEVSMPRQLVEPKGDRRFVRRIKSGQFKESDDVGRSLSQDRKRKAKKIAKKGEGDRVTERKRGSVKC